MSVETKTDLREETLEKVQQLVQANVDAKLALGDGVASIEDPILAKAMNLMATLSAKRNAELSAWVRANKEHPKNVGTWLGAWRRIWADIRSGLTAKDVSAVLNDVERSQQHLITLYQEIVLETAGSAMNDVLHRQLAEIGTTLDSIHELQEQYNAQSEGS